MKLFKVKAKLNKILRLSPKKSFVLSHQLDSCLSCAIQVEH